ncbi:MAG TPA: hypothetical protein DDW49_02925 [Deltaproteobacteria bacterium]|nr:MAG: hypothetical protein A2048_05240 [Deltaproteobacteria bacterium GWA2_45_12]HBF12333.1 hypothetical protein [Deltaproteobacteria bacterium]
MNILLVFATKPEWEPWSKNVPWVRSPKIQWPFYTLEGSLFSLPSHFKFFLAQTGIGYESISRKTSSFEQILTGQKPDLVLHLGVSGALTPLLKEGDLVLPTHVLASDEKNLPCDGVYGKLMEDVLMESKTPFFKGLLFSSKFVLADADAKRCVGEDTQALAVDMETYWMAQICEKVRVRFVALRGIFDAVDTDLTQLGDAGLVCSNGDINRKGLIKNLISKPKLLLSLPQFRKTMNLANSRLFTVTNTFLTKLAQVGTLPAL